MRSSVCWEAWASSLGSFGLLLGAAVTVTREGGNIVSMSKLKILCWWWLLDVDGCDERFVVFVCFETEDKDSSFTR
jgi:hypothetical protein